MRHSERDDVPDTLTEQNPGSTWLLWPHAKRGPWLIRIQWTRSAGRLECCGVEIKSFRETGQEWPPVLPTWDDDPQVLTAATLRKVPLGAIVNDLRESGWQSTLDLATDMDTWGDDEAFILAEQFRQMGQRNRGPRRRGIAPLDEVAAVYLAAQRRREHPTQAVERHWKVAHSTAAKWVMKARAEGHLPPSGKPTRKAAKK